MKYFILSRRFLIPLFIVWILHIAYLEWEMWRLYGADLQGKHFPASLIFEWLFLQAAGDLMIFAFLIAFLVAIVFFSYNIVNKKRSISSGFLSTWNLIVVLLFSTAVFIYASFIAPKDKLRSYEMLAALVWTKSYDEFKTGAFNIQGQGHKSSTTMTLPELFHAKDSLEAQDNIKEKYDFSRLSNQREFDRIRYEINKKIGLPFTVIVFYFLGICVGALFYRTHVIVPVLFSYFILFTAWFYIHSVFESLYYRQSLGVFFAANGTTLIFAFAAIALFFALKKSHLFKNKDDNKEPGQSSIF